MATDQGGTPEATSGEKVKTGIVMLNMGGPSEPEETGPFLKRLFQDADIIDLGGGKVQQLLGDFISSRRTPSVQKQYEEIGGSPIRKWTEHQGKEMCKLLDKQHPESAPHKAYTAFRYANPLTDVALKEMEKDGVEHAIAFSQFPQWSCTTSGSSMNELWREVKRLGLEKAFRWSAIDRWPLNKGWIRAVDERIRDKLLEFDEKVRSNVVIVFSAHSVPMKVVAKGDHYTHEVSASVNAIMDAFEKDFVKKDAIPGVEKTNKFVLAWQSKVGYMPWMVPSTHDVLENLGKKGHKSVLVVPVAFTSDHIETLYEIGMEYAEDAQKAGIANFKYTEGLNGSETFITALADIVCEHLDNGENHSPQYKMKCMTCTKPMCRQLMNPKY
uniref:Ferrochelatase n=1 Tax=Mucochytrium quahogii TaxID=96639 RepID=A0A7S2W492_9STRA